MTVLPLRYSDQLYIDVVGYRMKKVLVRELAFQREVFESGVDVGSRNRKSQIGGLHTQSSRSSFRTDPVIRFSDG